MKVVWGAAIVVIVVDNLERVLTPRQLKWINNIKIVHTSVFLHNLQQLTMTQQWYTYIFWQC